MVIQQDVNYVSKVICDELFTVHAIARLELIRTLRTLI